MNKGSKTWIESIGSSKYVVEPIGDLQYIVGDENNKFKVVEAFQDGKNYFIKINDEKIALDNVLNNTTFNFRPDLDMLDFLNSGDILKIKPENLFNSIYNAIRHYTDLKHDHDELVLALFIYQTYKVDNLQSLFLLSIDGDKNTGKTSVLELLNDLGYKFALMKDVTGAGLMRIVEKEGLNIGFDELDELDEKQKENVMSILRGSQRRNNKAIRLKSYNGDFVPERFDVFGSHAFSYRGNVEDALESRTMSIQMERTNDSSYSVVSAVREMDCYKLRNLLFYYRLFNYLEDSKKQEDFFTDFINKSLPHDRIISKEEAKQLRKDKYELLTEHLSAEAKEYMKGLYGRTSELFIVVVNLAESLGLDIWNLIERAFDKKVALMNTGFNELEFNVQKWLLEKHAYLSQLAKDTTDVLNPDEKNPHYAAGNYIRMKKSDFVRELNEYLKDKRHYNISASKFLSTVKQFGFVKGTTKDGANYGITNRIAGKPTEVLIFDERVLEKLGLKEDTNE